MWPAGASPQPLPGNLDATLPDVVYAAQAPTIRVWTKELMWGAIRGKVDVCGPKRLERPGELPRGGLPGGRGVAGRRRAAAHRSFQVAEAGGYDLYLVKYMG